MAYLNCPFCPAQAFAVSLRDHAIDNEDFLFMEYHCISKHKFYIPAKEEDVADIPEHIREQARRRVAERKQINYTKYSV